MKKLIFILLSLPLTAALAWWDGVEPSTGTKVEIYRISSHDRDVKFEVYDIDTGQDRTFIMESLSK